MNIYLTVKRLLFWTVLLVFISSCNTQPLPVAPVVEIENRLFIKNAPDWVNNGSGFMNEKGERLIHGVGYSPVVGDLAKQKAIADDIARTEVERLLSSFMSAMSSKYSGSVNAETSGVQVTDVSEVMAQSQVQAATRLSTSGTRIVKSWRDPRNNAVWSLALLDIKRVRNIADGQNEVDKDFLRFLEAEADNVFDSFINQKQ
jgi:hypothetical protein